MGNLAVLFERLQLDGEVLNSNPALFKEAFTHRSSVGDDQTEKNNERLEFLGDAVLELVTTEFLFKKFDLPEGELTNYRSALVKRENLAKVAKKVGFGDYLILSKGEERSGGRAKDYLLANAVEAFIGALYLTSGMEVTKNFIEDYILTELDDILQEGAHIDAKTRLQEITQGVFGITPSYEVVSERGKDHEKEFDMAVLLDGKKVGSGTGRSKKEAQIQAATAALSQQPTWESQFERK